MDSRIALRANTRLTYRGSVCFTLVKELGRGASGIVYDATYRAGSAGKDVKHVRIKECYPLKLHIQRTEQGVLQAAEADAAEFRKRCDAFEEAFHVGSRLSDAAAIKASLNPTIDTFHANGTVYLVSADLADQTLASFSPEDIHVCIALVKQVAFILMKLHEAGFLYLDIKPENVLIAQRETPQAVLFDFDAMIPLSAVKDRSCSLGQLRLCYSKGYAPIEQQLARLHQLGAYSDVFALGALLFALLFGRPPCAADCERGAAYPFDAMKYPRHDYQDKLFPALTAFFHRAIAVCRLDRYQTMQEAYTELKAIERLADRAAPFIRSSQLPAAALCIGRQAELARLHQWLKQPDSPCIFVTGMGGIGKSTLVQAFLKENRKQLDAVLYLLFSGSLAQTLTDDTAAAINHVARAPQESLAEYDERKRAVFRRLVTGTTTVLILDNYVYDTAQDLSALLNVGWKVIFISREPAPFDAYQQTAVTLDRLKAHADLLALFQRSLGCTVSESDLPYVEHIIERINGHTLVLKLIAKQIRSSHITIPKAAEWMDQRGFAGIGREKVTYEKDQKQAAQTIRDILTDLFRVSQLSDTRQNILKALALINEQGIDIHLFHSALALDTMDDVNELAHDGWLRCDRERLTMHPVIRETVQGWPWSEASRGLAARMMLYLFQQIRLAVDKNEYRRKPLLGAQVCEQHLRKHPDQRKKLEQRLTSKRPIGEIQLLRFYQCNESQPTDPREAIELISLSQGILSHPALKQELIEGSMLQRAYLNLLYQTILHVPCHEEAFILDRADELLHLSRHVQIQMMAVCQRITQIYLDRGDFPHAEVQLRKAERIRNLAMHSHAWAEYYDILSDYYDARLDGAYDSEDADDVQCRIKLMKAENRMIFFAGLAHQPDSRQLLAKGILGKATVLIRAYDAAADDGSRRKEIDHLLGKARKLVFSEAQAISKLDHQYHMVLAWYGALVENSPVAARDAMLHAKTIAWRIFPTKLDLIDSFLMPCANIYCSMGEYEAAERLLMDAVELCEQQSAILPYIREKLMLYGCLLDVYRAGGQSEKCSAIIDKMDAENERFRSCGMNKEASDRNSTFSENEQSGSD